MSDLIERKIDVRGLRLHLRERGPRTGPPVVLLHGWLDQGGSFDRLVPALGADLRSFALDHRGHGDSDWVGPGGFYHFVEYAADLDGALDALGLAMPDRGGTAGPIRLVGHSLGGAVALLYAAIRPERISHVTLLDAIPLLIQPGEVPQRLVEYLGDLKGSRSRRTVASIEHAAERLRKTSPALPEDAALHLARTGVSPDPAQGGKLAWKWDPWLRAHSPLPLLAAALQELLPGARAPMLLLRAGQTWLPEEPELRALLARLSGPLSIHTVAGTSHHLHLEQPAQVAQLIRDSWKENEEPKA